MPEAVTVGEIIRFIDGPVAPVPCIGNPRSSSCSLYGDCAFMGMWTRARDAVAEVYDTTTLQSLMDAQSVADEKYVASYCI